MHSSEMSVTGSRAEFITEDYPNIKYGRGGGCFVSHGKGFLALLFTAALSAAVAALLVFYLAPCPNNRSEYVSSLSLEERETSASTDSEVSDSTVTFGDGVGRRLPRGILPHRYRLCLTTFFEGNFTFGGQVAIDVYVQKDSKDTRTITLHSGDNLNITEGGVVVRSATEDDGFSCNGTVAKGNEDGVIPIKGHAYENSSEIYNILLKESLVGGRNYTIIIPFVGNLKENLYGYYRSSFKDSVTGEKRWIGVTQFESTYARDAFPCFDEPDLKARFLVSLCRPSTGFSLSNMRIRNSEPVESGEPSGWIWDHYEPSPPMSTYLLAFLVSPDKTSMEKVAFPATNSVEKDEKDAHDISFSIWSRPGFSNATDYALNLGKNVLKYYETYFGVDYPMTKMEMVAVPDFGAGAMENWGLVTYRESVLLYDPDKDSTSHKVEVALTVAHELAHQWFGNLVTMKWWNDLWLNEGFATYVEYIGTDHVEPEWKMLDRFVSEELQVTLQLDSLKSTHAVSPGNASTADSAAISEMFDSVSYGKGSCLVRMLNHTLGEQTFRKGLTNYLRKWSYANAAQDDLWESLTQEAMSIGATVEGPPVLPPGLTVKDVMDTWTLQEGFPVVTVTRNYEDGSARISQERFLLKDGSNLEEDSASPPKEKWHVPVTYTTAKESAFHRTKPRFWLLSGEGDKDLQAGSFPEADEWVLFNVQETGFYRVNYDERNWRLLINALLKHGSNSDGEMLNTLPDVTRAQIIDDAFSLARGGRLNYSIAFGLTRYLSNEKSLVPWTATLSAFRFLDEILVHTKHYGLLQRYVHKLLTPIFTSLVDKEDLTSVSEKLLRSMAMKWGCHFEISECVNRAKKLYNEWMTSKDPEKNNQVPSDDRKTVYCTAVKMGGKDEWYYLWKRFNAATNDSSASEVMLPALACTREPWIINMLIGETLETKDEDRVIRLQDTHIILRSMSGNPVAAPLLFQYMKSNWDRLHQRYGGSAILLGEIVKAGLSGLSSSQDLLEVKEFRKRNARKFRFATQDLQQAQEELEDRITWIKRNVNDVTTWLQEELASKQNTT